MLCVGSLIFVVVLLIWAIYLSLYVARRREQVSTARSVDRFSSHMRVLQRRTVKEAQQVEDGPSSGPTHTSILAAGALEDIERPADVRMPGQAGSAGAQLSSRGQVAREYLGLVHSNRLFAAWGGLTGVIDRLNPRRLRAYALLTFLLAGALSFVLAATGRIGWMLPGLCAAGVVGLLFWLRADRQAVIAARERRATVERSEAERAAVLAQRAAQEAAQEQARQAATARPEAGPLPVAQEHAPQRARRTTYEFFDLETFEPAPSTGADARRPDTSERSAAPAPEATKPVARPAAPASPARPRAAEDVAPSPQTTEPAAERLWQPVPVPPPTYTLKARAEHPMPPALQAPVAPEPIEIEDEFADVLWRRDAVGS